MHKRAYGTAAVLTSAALLVSACSSTSSGSSGGGTTSPSSTSSATASPSAVSSSAPARDANADLVIWADATAAPFVQALAAQFAQQNGVSVAVQIANDVRGQYETAFKAGQAPDIIVGAHDWLGELVANGAVAPVQLSSDVAAGFNPLAIKATQYNGQTYAVPYGVENLALVRNTALAPTAPATMEQLIATGKALVKAKKATNIMADQMGKTGDAYHGYPFLSACGGGIFGTKSNGDYDPANVIVGGAGSVKGAAAMGTYAKEGALSTNIDSTNADSLFQSGKVAFEITGPWSIPAFQKAGIKYAIDPLPSIAGCGKMQPFVGVQMFYVSSAAKNMTVAQTFVTSFITSEAAQESLFQIGQRPPALTAAYDKVVTSNPDVAAWATAAKGGQLMPNIPAMNSVWGPLGQAMADVISGKPAAATFKSADAAIVKNIKSAG